jgi:VanZ family protein
MALIFTLSGKAGASSRTLAMLQYASEFLHLSLSAETLSFLNFAIRKTAHFSIYLVLGLLVYRALAGGLTRFSLRFACWTAVFGLLYALTDEFHQVLVSSRTPSLYDVGLDFTGVVASQASLLFWSLFLAPTSQYAEPAPAPDTTGGTSPSTHSYRYLYK